MILLVNCRALYGVGHRSLPGLKISSLDPATPTDKFPITSEPGVTGMGWNLFSRSDVDCRRRPWSEGPPARYTHVVNDPGG